MEASETEPQLKRMIVVSLGVIKIRTQAIPKKGRRRMNNKYSHKCIHAKEVTHSKIVGMPPGRGRWLRLGAWMVMKWPVEPVSAIQVDVNMEKGVGLLAMWGMEETGALGVKVAGARRVMGAGRGEWCTSITENARDRCAVGPLS